MYSQIQPTSWKTCLISYPTLGHISLSMTTPELKRDRDRVIQGRSEVAERPCMTFPIKSMEIQQRFGDHKTLMNVQYIDERELVVWISTPLLVLRAGWYDFATRVAKPRVKAKSYHPNRKTSRSG